MQDDVTELGIFREAVVLLRDLAGRNVGDCALFDFFFFLWIPRFGGESRNKKERATEAVSTEKTVSYCCFLHTLYLSLSLT